MKTCVVLATFKVKPEFREEVRALLLAEQAIVLTEPGCLTYALHDDVSGDLVFVESWQSRELWMQHNDAPTVARITSGIEGKLVEPVRVQELYVSA
jgi:quinol monooxygenase YgiN